MQCVVGFEPGTNCIYNAKTTVPDLNRIQGQFWESGGNCVMQIILVSRCWLVCNKMCLIHLKSGKARLLIFQFMFSFNYTYYAFTFHFFLSCSSLVFNKDKLLSGSDIKSVFAYLRMLIFHHLTLTPSRCAIFQRTFLK